MAQELNPKNNLLLEENIDPLLSATGGNGQSTNNPKNKTTSDPDPLLQATQESNHIMGFTLDGKPIMNPSNSGVRLRREVNQVDPEIWKEYRRFEDRPFAQDLSMEDKIAGSKPYMEQFSNAMAQFGRNFVGGAAMALSSWDLSDAVDIAAGTEKEYGNALYKWAEEFMAEGREKNRVYTLNPGTFNPSDPNWWFQQTADLGTSAGFMAEMMLESLVLGSVTGGAGAELSIASKAKALKNIKNLGKAGGLSKILKSSKSLKNFGNQALFGLGKGYQEGLVEAYESYSSLEQQYLDKGFSKEEAKKFASLGAATTFRAGVLPNMLLNSLQFATMSYNPVTGATKSLFDRQIKNKVLRKSLGFTGQVASEGTEEAIQAMAQMEGQYQADLAAGQIEEQQDRFSKQLSSPETWNAFVAGGLGGAVFTGLGGIKNKFRNKEHQEHWSNKHSEFVDQMTSEKLNLLTQIKEAEAKGNFEKSMSLRRDMGAYNATKGLYLDALTDKDSGFKSYTEYLQNTLNYVLVNDTEKLNQLGVAEEDHEFIKENFPKYLEDASFIKDSFDKASNYNEREAIIPIVENEYKQRTLNQRLSEIDTEIEQARNSTGDFDKLSQKGIDTLQYLTTQEGITREITNLEQELKTLSGRKWNQVRALIEALEEKSIRLSEDFIFNKESVELTDDQRSLDSTILNSVDTEVLSDLEAEKQSIEAQQNIVRDNLSWWRDKKNQREVKRKNSERKVKKAKSAEKVKEVKEELKQEGKLDPKTEETVNSKIQDLEAKEAAGAVEDRPFGQAVAPDVVPELSDSEVSNARRKQASNINNIVDESTKDTTDSGDIITRADNDELYEPLDVTDMSEDNLIKLATSVKAYYDNLSAEMSQDPSFGDFIQDFIKHHGKEPTDRIYNALKEGWTRNNYPVADFDQVYKNFFLDRKSIGEDILSISEQMINPITDNNTLKTQEEKRLDQIKKEEAPIVELDNDNIPALRDETNFRTSTPELKAAHLSIPYQQRFVEDEASGETVVVREDTSEELNDSRFINSNKLLNPDLFNPGTKLTVRIPEDYRDVKVSLWEDEVTKSKVVTFSEWARNNNIEEFIQVDDKSKEFQEAGQQSKKNQNGKILGQWLLDNAQEGDTIVDENGEGYEVTEKNSKGDITLTPFTLDSNGNKIYNPEGSRLVSKVKLKQGDLFEYSFTDTEGNRRINSYSFKSKTPTGKKIPNPEWFNKIPMIAYDQDGEGVFFIHDTEWYNPVNVGLKDEPKKQKKVIDEARQSLSSIRSKIYDQSQIGIEITVKRPGTWNTIPKDQDAITINEANPDSMIAIANAQGELILNGKESFENSERELRRSSEAMSFIPGHTYQIRKSVAGEYIAFEVLRDKVNEASIQTIKNATEVYLYKYTDDAQLKSRLDNTRNQVLATTGLDLYDVSDFEKFLKQYVVVVNAEGAEGAKTVETTIESNSKIPVGTPYVTLQKGNLVFGVKGRAISGNNKSLYIHPRRIGDQGGKKQMVSMFSNFMNIVPTMTQNVSRDSLRTDRGMVTIDNKGMVNPIGNYQNFIKDQLKTNVKSYNVGTQENPVYATIIQPVINFKETESDWNTFVDTGKVSEEKVEEIADKIKEGTPLTAQEESMRREATEKRDGKEVNLVEEKLKEATEEVVDTEKEIQSYKDSLQALRELELPESDPAIQQLKSRLGEDTLDEPLSMGDEVVRKMAEELTGVEGLTISQNSQVVDFVFNQVAMAMDFKYKTKMSMGKVQEMLDQAFETYITPKKEEKQAILENLKSIAKEDDIQLQNVIKTFEKQMEVFTILEDNWKDIKKNGQEKVAKYTGITETKPKEDEIDIAQDAPQIEKNYSKTSLEENGKNASSYRLRRFFSGIQETTPDGKTKGGFLGIPTYVGFDTVYNTIGQVLSSPYEVGADFDTMIARLEENVENQTWLRQVIDKLKDADQQIKNEFVYNFAKHSLSMKFIMFSKTRDGAYTIKAYDTNSTEITRVIRTQWGSNLKQSGLVYVENGQYKISKDRAKVLIDQAEKWESMIDGATAKQRDIVARSIPNNQLQEWLGEFGINLSDETLDELKAKGLSVVTPTGKKDVSFGWMFRISDQSNGLFGVLARQIQVVSAKEDTEFIENESNHPFANASNILKGISRKESKYALYATTNSFRDGGKSIYGFTPSKYATDVVHKLKFNEVFRGQLGNKSYNKHSYVLNLLNSSEELREKFYVDHVGLTAIKEQGKKVFGQNDITSLPNTDHELAKLGFFQDVEQGKIQADLNGIDLRMARMFMPTMSDKTTMLTLLSPVLDLRTKHFEEGSTLRMGEALRDTMYSQLVLPELERIINFHATVGSTNIKGYDFAAQLFLMIPELNNLTDEASGQKVIALMKQNPATYNLEWFETNMKDKAVAVIQEVINQQVDNKRADWIDSGFITEDNEVKILNKAYINPGRIRGDQKTRVDVALNDFVINSMLTNANSHMLIAGDLAHYSQDKIAKKYFQDGNPFLPKESVGDMAYANAMKEVLGINIGKRLALLIAPGAKLANSIGSTYNQIYLNDYVDISSNIPTLVELFYNKTEGAKARGIINTYNNTKEQARRKAIADDLAEQYPEIADYLDIEATDAQEYTTAKEHIDVLWGQGRLSDEQYKDINSKLKSGKNLNYAELQLVMQPIKPVYTGVKEEQTYDTMRVMYVKSSSFPLLPQVTKGTELDKLRVLMEDFERETGKNTRASYQSANKVGAIKNPITPFNADGTFNDSLTTKSLQASTLTLDRNNFRIQQDVPFREDKDKVSLGTQTLKLLFGDGIMELDGFQFEGETYTGKELKEKFDDTYVNYIESKKADFYKQLGVNKDGQPVDVETTMDQMQKLLKAEAESRGYPRQDIEALKLVPKYDSKGNVIDIQFTTPLWLSPNSNRYEALLNAIVTNRLVNVKLPGASYVAGSEAGFKLTDSKEGIKESSIVYTSSWEGELKAAEFHKDGTLKYAQVLAPSKLRDNKGNLINLIKRDGKPNEKYVTRAEDGSLRIKEDTIDSDLLNLTSFRIPTSGHVSMSQVEIVGILPVESGDLMIMPRNFTKQKGLDFDVDKETTYKPWSYEDVDGNIKVLDEIGKQYLLEEASKISKVESDTTRVVDNFLTALFGDEFDTSDITKNNVVEKLEQKLSEKLMENQLVMMHKSVLSNPKAQTRINKVLSMDFAKSQAELIDGAINQNVDNKYFTTLADSYQKEKMFLGASGKLGIGVYSNYVVFNSMAQQLPSPLQLNEYDEEGNLVPFKVTIGKFTSNGQLGITKSLATGKLQRSIADIFAERQNTATDNEKEQIMGRVNINEITINVDSLLSALGFDKDVLKDGTEVSIPYLLLSQPIIRDYVKEMRKIKSKTSEYDPLAASKVSEKLQKKYDVPGGILSAIGTNRLLTGDVLYENVKGNVNNTVQLAALMTFFSLERQAAKIAGIQGRLNINNTGLGKSYFETIDKYEGLQALGKSDITGVSNLVGIFTKPKSKEEAATLIEEGYVKIDDQYIKPTTPVGAMLVHSVGAGYDLWKDFFPYDNKGIRDATNQIISMTTSEETSDSKIIERRQNIFKDMKKYFVSSSKLGIVSDDPQQDRARLFMDTDTNTSLANYLATTMSMAKNYPDILNNKLLNRFDYTLNTNGIPSTIKFDNTKGENFDEDYLYMSLIELLDKNTKLPNYNGQSYTTRDLANDLIKYSYLEGGIQEAVQFVKYIPVSYLNNTPFASITREWMSKDRKDSIFKAILGLNDNVKASRFTRQYAQHNPEQFPKVETDNMSLIKYKDNKTKGNISDIESFILNANTMEEGVGLIAQDAQFLSVYDPFAKKGLKKFSVFQKDGVEYKKISTLGTFGMAEYSVRETDVRSVVNDYFITEEPTPVTGAKESTRDSFQLSEGKLDQVIGNIAQFDFQENKHLGPLAEALIPFVTNDITIEITDLVNDQGQRIARGRYTTDKNKLSIDRVYMASATEEDLAKTILHESVHALTTDYIRQYVDKDGNFKVDNPPANIINLSLLFNEVKKKLGPESEAYKKKREDQKSGVTSEPTTERERTVAYGGTRIEEFVALVMTEPNFQKEMDEVKYMSTDMTLWERFTELVNNIVKGVLGESYTSSGVTYQGVKTVLSLVESQAQQKKDADSYYQQMKDNDIQAEQSMGSAFGNIVTPDQNDFEKPSDLDTFEEDPFDCA